MQFTIEHAPVYATLRVDMERGERFRAEPGAMLSMSPSIELETTTAGKGLMGTLKAAVGGADVGRRGKGLELDQLAVKQRHGLVERGLREPGLGLVHQGQPGLGHALREHALAAGLVDRVR